MPSLIRGLLSKEEVKVSYEKLVRDYAYVKDVAGAICHCLFSDYTGAVNISGGSDATIGEIAELIKKNTSPDGKVVFKAREENDQPLYIRGDTSLLSSLGWTHKYSLEDGLIEEIEEMKNEENIVI
jgi:nucleoside-diphosphate-sugar epimerase